MLGSLSLNAAIELPGHFPYDMSASKAVHAVVSRRHICWRVQWRVHLCSTAPVVASGERSHRCHRLRPRRQVGCRTAADQIPPLPAHVHEWIQLTNPPLCAHRRYLSTGVFAEDAGQDDPAPCTVDEYPSAVARLIVYPEPHFVFFRASDDPATGLYQDWISPCPPHPHSDVSQDLWNVFSALLLALRLRHQRPMYRRCSLCSVRGAIRHVTSSRGCR
jgi:hypothetical protein